jgi:pimeloyl-ACP methyl ester carboxylesterase
MGSGPVAEIEVEGRRLAWRSAGQGPPLLLINGYAATGSDGDPGFLGALAESFEVVCPDNRGVGDSDVGWPLPTGPG